MGFTGLARWVNAPTTGLQLIRENIVSNHNGKHIGKWSVSVKSYRSTFRATGVNLPSERTMCTLTMNDNVFVLLEDPLAPTRADCVAAASDPAYAEGEIPPIFVNPTHYRTTFLTLSPPNSLEQLLVQLKARWVPVRQAANNVPARQGTGQQLVIEGLIFTIGTDWLLRVGHVVLAGGALRGMLLEAEYLPLPTLHSPTDDGTSELLSNLLTSVLPNVRDAKTVAVTISDSQWEEFLWDKDDETQAAGPIEVDQDDELYVYGDEDLGKVRKGDWTGVDRDRRSAFLIIGSLKSEGIL